MDRTYTIYGILLKDQIYESWIQKGEKTIKNKENMQNKITENKNVHIYGRRWLYRNHKVLRMINNEQKEKKIISLHHTSITTLWTQNKEIIQKVTRESTVHI